MMNEFAVQVDHIEKIFGDFTAVNRISFKVRKGEIFGFLGPNGAGKSTTIRMLCGLLVPTSGTGSVAGFDIIKDGEKIKENIGYMSQKFSLYEDLTVEENIDFYSGIYKLPRSKKKDRKDWVLKMAGLEDHKKTKTSVLSGGWKQRLALGCAIIHEPPILFLDEPTSGVDPISRRQFWELINGLSESGVTVFVTTHYMDEAEYCDRIALIYRGDLIALGTSGSLKTEFMKEDIIDIDCSLPQDAMEILEGLKGIKEVALFGKGLHAVAEENVEKLVPRIKELLGTNGYAVNRVEKIMPSLEDVFVSMIEAYDRSLEPQKGVSL
ncbi:ABC transporter ATP-binding protein [Desulforegula conservatrix]|uniref:ABC transporter ATP-binding protein n=1 Tax=Desulforegula conservatrix TaxID=153026 RepID=UPI0018DDCD14|nr:ABC transporter ATP-binding protein [Desulforegula conservatrix]